jgi:hypothetical protein
MHRCLGAFRSLVVSTKSQMRTFLLLHIPLPLAVCSLPEALCQGIRRPCIPLVHTHDQTYASSGASRSLLFASSRVCASTICCGPAGYGPFLRSSAGRASEPCFAIVSRRIVRLPAPDVRPPCSCTCTCPFHACLASEGCMNPMPACTRVKQGVHTGLPHSCPARPPVPLPCPPPELPPPLPQQYQCATERSHDSQRRTQGGHVQLSLCSLKWKK